jgi:hypothetical protein
MIILLNGAGSWHFFAGLPGLLAPIFRLPRLLALLLFHRYSDHLFDGGFRPLTGKNMLN